MAAKRLVFEGTDLQAWSGNDITVNQRAALAERLAAWPGCVMRVWQRTHKGWLVVEIDIGNGEQFKFRINHRAQVSKARIERI